MNDSATEFAVAIERVSLASWPAVATESYGCWLLRHGDGYTKRANCATLAEPHSGNIDEQIAHFEHFYGSRDLATIVRLPSIFSPDDVDAALARRGYDLVDPTLVMTLPLAGPGGTDREVEEIQIALLHDYFARFSSISPGARASHEALLERIPGRRVIVAIRHDSQIAGVALGVVNDGMLGVFDVVIDSGLRGQGLGTRLMRGLVDLATRYGAAHSYLQVVAANVAAVRAYRSVGYEQAYRYWYRVKPGA